ncbi:MAG: hypothetical protein V3R25_03275 [Nitrosomonadaceae bacterium]
MIEIIPNWHPVFVHFTVALLSLAVGFHVICPLLPDRIIKQQFNILARSPLRSYLAVVCTLAWPASCWTVP